MERCDPKRVLTCYYRPKPGGFCSRYFRAINALLDRGCEVHYLAVVRFPISHPHCYFHRFPWPANKTDSLLFWAVFHSLAPFVLAYLGIRWKVSHCFAFGSNYGCILKPITIIKSIPLVLFLRGDSFAHHNTKNRPKWLIGLEFLIEGIAISGINVYCVSDFLQQRVRARHRWLQPASIATLRNDIVLRPRSGKNVNCSVIHAGCVGVLEAHKNQALLIKVLSKFNQGEIKLNLFGVGPDHDRLAAMINSLGIESEVNLRGWVDPNRLWDDIDILLMPSLYEGCPNAVLEALGYSVPVLASDIPAHREILPGQNMIPLNDHELWCERLRKILRTPDVELKRLQELQNAMARSLIFDWDKRTCDLILIGI